MRKPEQFKHITTDDQWDKINGQILRELNAAERQFPDWPIEIDRGVAIMMEEAGETQKAAIDYSYGRGTKGEIKTELIQTAAMCIRMLSAMEPKAN